MSQLCTACFSSETGSVGGKSCFFHECLAVRCNASHLPQGFALVYLQRQRQFQIWLGWRKDAAATKFADDVGSTASSIVPAYHFTLYKPVVAVLFPGAEEIVSASRVFLLQLFHYPIARMCRKTTFCIAKVLVAREGRLFDCAGDADHVLEKKKQHQFERSFWRRFHGFWRGAGLCYLRLVQGTCCCADSDMSETVAARTPFSHACSTVQAWIGVGHASPALLLVGFACYPAAGKQLLVSSEARRVDSMGFVDPRLTICG